MSSQEKLEAHTWISECKHMTKWLKTKYKKNNVKVAIIKLNILRISFMPLNFPTGCFIVSYMYINASLHQLKYGNILKVSVFAFGIYSLYSYQMKGHILDKPI